MFAAQQVLFGTKMTGEEAIYLKVQLNHSKNAIINSKK